jgi:general secretion pathway protein G
VSRRLRIETWGGFLIGLLVTPLFLLWFAVAITALFDGLDTTGEYGLAITGARDLAAAMDRYRARYHHVPDAKEGLAALVPEFIGQLPRDPWGHPYVYESTGPLWADVLSYGADGEPGGSGGGADISARFGRLGSRPPGFVRQLASVVIVALPILAALTGGKRLWVRSALAGMSAFWGVILLATVSTALRTSIVPWISFTAGVACFVGAVALLRNLVQARLVSLVSIAIAYLLLQYLVITT